MERYNNGSIGDYYAADDVDKRIAELEAVVRAAREAVRTQDTDEFYKLKYALEDLDKLHAEQASAGNATASKFRCGRCGKDYAWDQHAGVDTEDLGGGGYSDKPYCKTCAVEHDSDRNKR